MQSFTRVLLTVKAESESLPAWLSTFGSEPKMCTGYRNELGAYYVPVDTLIKQGFSILFLDDEPDYFDNPQTNVGMHIDGKPCIWFFRTEVEVLVN